MLKDSSKSGKADAESITGLNAALSIVYVVVLFLASQLVAGLLIGAIGIALGHKPDSINDWLQSSAPGQFGFILMAESLAFLGIWFLAGRTKKGLAALGISKPKRDVLKTAVLGYLTVFILLIIVNILVANFLPQVDTKQKQNIGFEKISTHSDVLLTFISLVILPPLAEEGIVRGYLYSKLRLKFSFKITLLLTSLLFGAAHLQFGEGAPLLWSAAIDIFVLALVLGYLREKTGNIWAGVLVHSGNNLLAFLITFHKVIF